MSNETKAGTPDDKTTDESPELSDQELEAVAGGTTGDPIPTESISMNFTKIEFKYQPQSSDGSLVGSVRAGYPVKKS